MDHTVKPSVKRLAASLMDNVPTNWTDALSDLDALSELTTQALAPAAPETPAPAVETFTATQLEATAALARREPSPEVSIPERYEGAPLKDQQVVDALLAYHRLHAPVLGATTSPKPAKNSARNVFSPMEIPIIEAAPKTKSANQQAGSSGYSSSILKPTKK